MVPRTGGGRPRRLRGRPRSGRHVRSLAAQPPGGPAEPGHGGRGVGPVGRLEDAATRASRAASATRRGCAPVRVGPLLALGKTGRRSRGRRRRRCPSPAPTRPTPRRPRSAQARTCGGSVTRRILGRWASVSWTSAAGRSAVGRRVESGPPQPPVEVAQHRGLVDAERGVAATSSSRRPARGRSRRPGSSAARARPRCAALRHGHQVHPLGRQPGRPAAEHVGEPLGPPEPQRRVESVGLCTWLR